MERQLARIGIRAKIILAFSLVLVCTAGLGLFAIQRLTQVNDAAAEIRTTWLPATRTLGVLSYTTMRYRQLEASHAISADPQAKATEAKKLATVGADADKAFAEYKAEASTPAERKILDEMSVFWAQYHELSARFVALSTAQRIDEAGALYRGEMRTVFNKFQDKLKADVALNVEGGNAAAARGAELGAEAKMWIGIVVAIAAVLCALIGWSLVRGISRPITQMTEAMRRLASQDFGVDVPGRDRQDEIGAMAGAVETFRQNGLEMNRLEGVAATERGAAESARVAHEAQRATAEREQQAVVHGIASGLSRLAAGDLLHRLEEPFAPDYESLRIDFNAAVAQLQKTMTAVAGTTGAIRMGTDEISTASADLARRTEQQAASLEETAATLDEITAAVTRTADGSARAHEVVADTRLDAERSGEVVVKAIAAMGEIEKSSRQISQIIGIIDEIAFQTNLLALNAGVEAARASEAGRGFAVVASEVRALAQRSADAAREIGGLIRTSDSQVSTGAAMVKEAGEALAAIVRKIVEVSSLVSEIAGSAREQANGLQQVNTAITQMDQTTQRNAAMCEESTAAAQSLARETQELAGMIAAFSLGAPAAAASVVRVPAPVPARPMPRQPVAAVATARKPLIAAAAGADSWEEF